MRIGSVGVVLGAVTAGIGNLLHPVTPRNDPGGVVTVIAHSQHWTLIHMVIIFGVILMLAGLLGIRHSITTLGLTGALTRLGMWAATIGTTIGLITVVLDGVAAKQLANQWAAAADPSRQVALGLVSANETVNFALAGMFNLSFAGVPFILFGLAVARSGSYPRWLVWVAYAAGVGSVGAGLVQAFTGEPTTTSLILTIIGPTVICLWLLVMGTLLWRRARFEPLNPPASRLPLAQRRHEPIEERGLPPQDSSRIVEHWRPIVWHTIFITVHAASATTALIAGIVAVPRGRLFSVYLGSLVTMEVFLVLAIGVQWPARDGATRIIFAALAGLGAVVVWCGLQARRSRPGDDDAGLSSRYFASLGFTLIALVDAFLVIAVLNVGAPGWAGATTGVLAAVVGHIVLRVERRRLIPGTCTGPKVAA